MPHGWYELVGSLMTLRFDWESAVEDGRAELIATSIWGELPAGTRVQIIATFQADFGPRYYVESEHGGTFHVYPEELRPAQRR